MQARGGRKFPIGCADLEALAVLPSNMAVGQNQWYQVCAPPISVNFSGLGMFTGDTIWILTHGHIDPGSDTQLADFFPRGVLFQEAILQFAS